MAIVYIPGNEENAFNVSKLLRHCFNNLQEDHAHNQLIEYAEQSKRNNEPVPYPNELKRLDPFDNVQPGFIYDLPRMPVMIDKTPLIHCYGRLLDAGATIVTTDYEASLDKKLKPDLILNDLILDHKIKEEVKPNRAARRKEKR